MSEYERADKHVPHEAAVDEAIDDQMRRTSSHAAIDDLGAPSSSYVEAEAVAMTTAVNSILAVLRDAELIPESLSPQ